MSVIVTLNISVYISDMKTTAPKRNYQMKARAKAKAQTGHDIIAAAVQLWKDYPLHEITLEQVAEKAGVTVRTVLRRFESKEGLFQASLQQEAHAVSQQRKEADSKDVPTALQGLLADYEAFGDANIRTLRVEEELPIAHQILQKGRQFHREWCAQVFAPYLPPADHPDYETRLMAFYSATDVYQWKVLRRDFGKSKKATYQIMQSLVQGLIQQTR